MNIQDHCDFSNAKLLTATSPTGNNPELIEHIYYLGGKIYVCNWQGEVLKHETILTIIGLIDTPLWTSAIVKEVYSIGRRNAIQYGELFADPEVWFEYFYDEMKGRSDNAIRDIDLNQIAEEAMKRYPIWMIKGPEEDDGTYDVNHESRKAFYACAEYIKEVTNKENS